MGEGPVLKLKAIGYWRTDQWGGRLVFPQPQRLVRPAWHADELAQIAAYLRSGHTFARWSGYSFCRFGCGIDRPRMGSTDLTDGEWVWPAGLAHYVEAHAVALPEELVEAMRRHGWRVPDLDHPPRFGPGPEPATFDFSFWVEWARAHEPS
jgi:hypothetical protein